MIFLFKTRNDEATFLKMVLTQTVVLQIIKEIQTIFSTDKLNEHLAPGGGRDVKVAVK